MIHAFADAIHDGVDIITMSIYVKEPKEYFDNGIVIGSFHAMVHGILTVVCAGIEGPDRGTVDNLAPWLLTVGVDRESSLVMLHLETISNSSEQALRLKARYLKIFMNWSAEKMPDSPMQLLKMREYPYYFIEL